MSAINLAIPQLRPDSHYDTWLLIQLFTYINRRYFDDHIHATVRWEIPAGSVSVALTPNRRSLAADSPLHGTFASAIQLIKRDASHAALPLLIECADGGHDDAHLLLNHLLKRLGDERWREYARRYNYHQGSHRSVPAACYYPESRVIAVHPYLHERRAPQFVLKYLIYHECCHQLIKTDCGLPHPAAFMEWEFRAPGRRRALKWLDKQGFPTLPMHPAGD